MSTSPDESGGLTGGEYPIQERDFFDPSIEFGYSEYFDALEGFLTAQDAMLESSMPILAAQQNFEPQNLEVWRVWYAATTEVIDRFHLCTSYIDAETDDDIKRSDTVRNLLRAEERKRIEFYNSRIPAELQMSSSAYPVLLRQKIEDVYSTASSTEEVGVSLTNGFVVGLQRYYRYILPTWPATELLRPQPIQPEFRTPTEAPSDKSTADRLGEKVLRDSGVGLGVVDRVLTPAPAAHYIIRHKGTRPPIL